MARPKLTPRAARESRFGVLTRGFTLPRASQRYWSAIKKSMLGLSGRRGTPCCPQPANCKA